MTHYNDHGFKKNNYFGGHGFSFMGLYIFYPYLRFMINYLSMPDTEVSRVEVARISSPDAKLDAVVIRTNVNATTPYGHDIYLVPTGSKPKYDRANFRADHFEGWKVTWKQPKLLEIEYDEARIFHFSNFWQSIDLMKLDMLSKFDWLRVRRSIH